MAKVKKEVVELEVPVEVNEVVDVIETEGTIITDEVVNAEPEVMLPEDTDVVGDESIIINEPTAEPIESDEELATSDKCECDGLPFVVKNRKGSIKLCIKCNKPK